MSTKLTDAAERLGAAVRARREDLSLSQLEIHGLGGPSNSTQTEIENDRQQTLSLNLAKKLDKGLWWEPGSAMRVWRGDGKPTPKPLPNVGGVTDDTSMNTGDVDKDAALLAALIGIQRSLDELVGRFDNWENQERGDNLAGNHES